MLSSRWVTPGYVPKMLGAFLLLATSMNAQNKEWDNAICTEDVVFVSRGEHAMMACNISNTFTHITIKLRAHGKNKTIFSEDGPGHFSRDGWQLQVQGGQAQLVIEAAQDSHAGQYLWRLHGLQACNKITTLNVSEPQDQEADQTEPLPSWDSMPETLESKSFEASTGPRSTEGVVAAGILFLILIIVGIGAFTQNRLRHS
ncbi:secreted and transmembrane protein 1A-like isoform X2 [Castor canadensis]|uniref:Secreted and transmembrane protein 1A-like isoform X2 n=1 Tax=Castor canadensis TaxID=51338 RepID=A0A8B7WI39_CASCN